MNIGCRTPNAERLLTLLLLSCCLAAGEVTVTTAQHRPLAQEPVVLVNGEAITLGDLELALLRQEGADLMEASVKKDLEDKVWETLADDQPVLSVRVTRGRLALELLRQSGIKVRGELIDILLVEQAVRREGISLDARAQAEELARMQKRLDQGLEKRGKSRTDLRTLIQNQYGMSLDRWTEQKGFRVLMGLHALLDRYAASAISDAEVAEWVAKHPDRFRTPEAADVAVLFLAFPTREGAAPDAEDKANTLRYVKNIHEQVRQGRLSFEQLWTSPAFGAAFQRVYPDAKPGARIGWVLRSGRREGAEGRGISPQGAERAFAAQRPWPALLEPVEAIDGVELILVHDRREVREVVLAEVAAQVRRDIVDETIDVRQKRLMDDLRKVAVLDYRDLTPLINRRAAAVGAPVAGVPLPAGGP